MSATRADDSDGDAPGVRFDSAVVRFGDVVAVDGFSGAFAGGRTTAIIGPSGCGKSTLLRLVVGLAPLMSGRVTVGDAVVDGGTTPEQLRALRRRCGFVLQEGGLFPHLSARANATLLARRIGWTKDRCDIRLGELAELTRLPGDVFARAPGELSGGQRQRVALIRALFLDPPILLLDEPFGALDPIVRFELQDEFRAIAERLGKTVLIVTHDLSEAMHLADRVVLMRDGRLVQDDEPDQLVRQPADDFAARFVRAQRVRASAEAS